MGLHPAFIYNQYLLLAPNKKYSLFTSPYLLSVRVLFPIDSQKCRNIRSHSSYSYARAQLSTCMYLHARKRVYAFSISNVTQKKPFSYRKDLVTLFFDVAKNNTPRFSPTFLSSTSTCLLRVLSFSSHLPLRVGASSQTCLESFFLFLLLCYFTPFFRFPSFALERLPFTFQSNLNARCFRASSSVRPRLRFVDVHMYADSRRRHCHYYYRRITDTGCHFASLSLAFPSYCFNGK